MRDSLVVVVEFVFAMKDRLRNINENSYNNFTMRVGQYLVAALGEPVDNFRENSCFVCCSVALRKVFCTENVGSCVWVRPVILVLRFETSLVPW